MRTSAILLLTGLSLFRPAHAVPCTWTGGSGDWSVASNWSCGAVPGADDDVTVNTFDAVITLNTAATIGDLTFGRGTLTGTGDLTVNGAFAWTDGGSLGLAGTVTVFGGSQFSSQVSMRLTGTLDLASNSTWSNGNITMTDGAVLINRSGRTFTDSAVSSHSIARVSVTATEPVVTNVGTWITEGVGGTGMNVQFNNTGALVVAGGGLRFNSPARLTNAGTGVIRGLALLDVASGTVFVNDGSTQPGATGTAPAQLPVRGAFPMGADHDLQIDLAGPVPGSEYDQLAVEDGDVTVDGRLFLTFSDGFVPAVGQAFDVLVHTGVGAVSGCYEEGDIVVSPEAYDVAVTCTSSGVTAEVIAVTAGEPTGAAPEALTLAPAYPNPVSRSAGSEATLAYTTATAGHVRIAVFDVLGRAVATVLDEVRPAGAQQASWQVQGLPAGLYVVRITAGGQTVTRRVTVVD